MKVITPYAVIPHKPKDRKNYRVALFASGEWETTVGKPVDMKIVTKTLKRVEVYGTGFEHLRAVDKKDTPYFSTKNSILEVAVVEA